MLSAPALSIPAPPGKLCTKCGAFRALEMFPTDAKLRDGRSSWCRVCKSRLARDWARRNPEKRNAAWNRWRERNPEKHKEMVRAWRRRNPEKARAALRRWRERNPEKAKEYARQWQKKNPEKAREAYRRWYRSHPEKARAKNRAYRERHPEKVRAWRQRAARRRMIRFRVDTRFRKENVRRLVMRFGHYDDAEEPFVPEEPTPFSPWARLDDFAEVARGRSARSVDRKDWMDVELMSVDAVPRWLESKRKEKCDGNAS